MEPEFTLGKENLSLLTSKMFVGKGKENREEEIGQGREHINEYGTLRRIAMTAFSLLHSGNPQQIVSVQYDFI